MNEEEKKTIKYFYNLRATIDESNMLFDEDINVKCGKETIKQITTILNLIEKQQAELKKKDKIIDLMANDFWHEHYLYFMEIEKLDNKDELIEYFTKQVEKRN